MLTTSEVARLRTFAIEIAASLLRDAPRRDEGYDRRFGDAGGLVIDQRRGCWWSYSAGRGGWSTVDLIALIKNDWSRNDVEQWALEKAPDAVFEVYPAPVSTLKDIRYDTIICEGLEDGLSAAWLQRPFSIAADVKPRSDHLIPRRSCASAHLSHGALASLRGRRQAAS